MRYIYLSGPMRGIKSANFPAFDFAAAKLRAQGFSVFSPADNDRAICGWSSDYIPGDNELEVMCYNGTFTTRKCFLDDMMAITQWADTVAVLRNHEKSSGVAAEVALAKALGLNIIYLGNDYHDETIGDARELAYRRESA